MTCITVNACLLWGNSGLNELHSSSPLNRDSAWAQVMHHSIDIVYSVLRIWKRQQKCQMPLIELRMIKQKGSGARRPSFRKIPAKLIHIVVKPGGIRAKTRLISIAGVTISRRICKSRRKIESKFHYRCHSFSSSMANSRTAVFVHTRYSETGQTSCSVYTRLDSNTQHG